MPQYHVWRKSRSESDFAKIGDFTTATRIEEAAVAAEGAGGLQDGAVYFVEPTDGGRAVLYRARPTNIGLTVQ